MKKLLVLTLTFFTVVAAFGQAPASEMLELKEPEFNFGKIPQGKPVYHSFELRNNSSQPIKLDDVQASCGCTTPEWSKEPIPPGGSSLIRVGYNAASGGPFEKFISLTYNGKETKQIKIKGEVWQAPTGPAPANASLQFLKQQIQ